jgi:hypothetical protein
VYAHLFFFFVVGCSLLFGYTKQQQQHIHTQKKNHAREKKIILNAECRVFVFLLSFQSLAHTFDVMQPRTMTTARRSTGEPAWADDDPRQIRVMNLLYPTRTNAAGGVAEAASSSAAAAASSSSPTATSSASSAATLSHECVLGMFHAAAGAPDLEAAYKSAYAYAYADLGKLDPSAPIVARAQRIARSIASMRAQWHIFENQIEHGTARRFILPNDVAEMRTLEYARDLEVVVRAHVIARIEDGLFESLECTPYKIHGDARTYDTVRWYDEMSIVIQTFVRHRTERELANRLRFADQPSATTTHADALVKRTRITNALQLVYWHWINSGEPAEILPRDVRVPVSRPGTCIHNLAFRAKTIGDFLYVSHVAAIYAALPVAGDDATLTGTNAQRKEALGKLTSLYTQVDAAGVGVMKSRLSALKSTPLPLDDTHGMLIWKLFTKPPHASTYSEIVLAATKAFMKKDVVIAAADSEAVLDTIQTAIVAFNSTSTTKLPIANRLPRVPSTAAAAAAASSSSSSSSPVVVVPSDPTTISLASAELKREKSKARGRARSPTSISTESSSKKPRQDEPLGLPEGATKVATLSEDAERRAKTPKTPNTSAAMETDGVVVKKRKLAEDAGLEAAQLKRDKEVRVAANASAKSASSKSNSNFEPPLSISTVNTTARTSDYEAGRIAELLWHDKQAIAKEAAAAASSDAGMTDVGAKPPTPSVTRTQQPAVASGSKVLDVVVVDDDIDADDEFGTPIKPALQAALARRERQKTSETATAMKTGGDVSDDKKRTLRAELEAAKSERDTNVRVATNAAAAASSAASSKSKSIFASPHTTARTAATYTNSRRADDEDGRIAELPWHDKQAIANEAAAEAAAASASTPTSAAASSDRDAYMTDVGAKPPSPPVTGQAKLRRLQEIKRATEAAAVLKGSGGGVDVDDDEFGPPINTAFEAALKRQGRR